MSTDDRFVVFQSACKCGAGEIQIECVTPDHPWARASQTRYEERIDCDACEREYAIVRQAGGFYLIDRNELDQKRNYLTESHKISDALRQHPKVRAAFDQLVQLLASQRSVASTYRLLVSAGLEYISLATFRKRWQDANAWVSSHMLGAELGNLLQLLKIDDQVLWARLKEAERLRLLSSKPYRNLDKPLYQISD